MADGHTTQTREAPISWNGALVDPRLVAAQIAAEAPATLADLYPASQLALALETAARRGVSKWFNAALTGEVNAYNCAVAAGRRHLTSGPETGVSITPLRTLLRRAQERKDAQERWAASPEGRVRTTLHALEQWADGRRDFDLSSACYELQCACDRNFANALPFAEKLHAAADGQPGARAFTGLIVETMKGGDA